MNEETKAKENWNPGFYDYKKAVFNPGKMEPDVPFIPYEKSWYCSSDKIIHTSEKSFLRCKKCNPD